MRVSAKYDRLNGENSIELFLSHNTGFSVARLRPEQAKRLVADLIEAIKKHEDSDGQKAERAAWTAAAAALPALLNGEAA